MPYARDATGIRIYGDAHTWWQQAEGRYKRGHRPKPGAVMLRHANWSPINGKRGQVERNVRAIDTSPGNDWSEVRVWYDPLQALGTTRWPLHGFIYGEGPAASPARTKIARAKPARSSRRTDPIADIIAGRYR